MRLKIVIVFILIYLLCDDETKVRKILPGLDIRKSLMTVKMGN